MGLFKKKSKKIPLEELVLPRHIGIVMDGNGRWAKKRGLPRMAGHSFGAEKFKKINEYCLDRNIEVVTFYAFSTENWKRSKEEVSNIMDLFVDYLHQWLDMDDSKNMKVRFLGDRSVLSPKAQELMAEVEKKSQRFKNQLNIAINYGARSEILRAFELLKGKESITEQDISDSLYTYGQPDVDLIIRTGGEKRLSNFLLWQAAYAEIYFTDVLWPDISFDDIDDALRFYSSRQRRFGGV
ncbi:MAG: di-trans,poly-cis-decaprenylcistransferase [Ruminococcaceae bacterium]|nr:di-trans,poly-cis-decaprenylcistransferase [Oscillospiraceae bacterium]